MAELTGVSIANTNGVYTEIESGLAEDDIVILYPSVAVEDGSKVERRQ